MLYTIRPLERIYADPSVFRVKQTNDTKDIKYGSSKANEIDGPEYREVILPNGRITTRKEGEGYVVERINSTDMKDYLNEKYSPGASFKS